MKVTKIPKFRRFVLQNFPFIEQDFDALTDYALICKVVEYLNKVISQTNANTEQVSELSEAFNNLENYVEHYFDNLDVQNEINIKLESMVESGELTEIIGSYVNTEVMPLIDTQNENITNINGRVDQISTKINDIVSLNPIPVSSTDAMTDHSKVYLLTTSGHWYYYDTDESAFVDGGTYQSTIPTDLDDSNIKYKGITPASLKQYSTINLADDYTNSAYGLIDGVSISPVGVVQTGLAGDYKTFECLVPQNSFITINKPATSSRFRVALSVNRIANGDTVEILSDNTSLTNVSLYTGSYNWVNVMVTNNSQEPDVNVYLHNREQIKDLLGAENLIPFVPVPAGTELYNPSLKLEGIVIGNQNNKYALQKDSYTTNGRSYMFGLVSNTTYTIIKSGGNRFKVALYRDYPTFQDRDNDSGAKYFNCRPSKVIVDDNDETEAEFDSEEYKYCVVTTSISAENYTLSIKANKDTYELSKQWYSTDIDDQSVYIFNPEINSLDSFWELWGGRLAWGINTSIAPVPVQVNSQLFVNGMIIAHLNPENTQGYNRHSKHVFEAYDSDNYSRLTMLLHKHQSETDGKKSFEQYYYTGADHSANSYANVKIGSDVINRSFTFTRDKMTANGTIDCKFPLQVARINPDTDLDNTYQTVAQADSAYEAENQNTANTKCVKWISLHNAPDGTLFYDEKREKLVVKINGVWNDVNTTPVPIDTYDF